MCIGVLTPRGLNIFTATFTLQTLSNPENYVSGCVGVDEVSRAHLPGVHGEEDGDISGIDGSKRFPYERKGDVDERDEEEEVVERLFLFLRAVSRSQRGDGCGNRRECDKCHVARCAFDRWQSVVSPRWGLWISSWSGMCRMCLKLELRL